jgi:glutamate/tyrosine decarboxylase-like PLP-dependent enzyme/glutathione synthase/RimK-type ligase-like ATP-grasp enzyme
MLQGIDDQLRRDAEDVSPELRETLDPADWGSFRAQAHRMLDDMLGYVENIRERPVWQPIPAEVRSRFQSSTPRQATDLPVVHEEFMQDILPFAAGNVHPGFMGWVHGGGTPVGMMAELLAAGLNANLGGRDHAPIEVERQVGQWTREIFGFPETATGLFVTGTSMANLIAVIIARDAACGFEVRRSGIGLQAKKLTAYASTAVHGCIGRAMDMSGVGSDALRLVETDTHHRIDIASLERAIQQDREAGLTPLLVVGSAGTVDTGAIDDLVALADLCQREQIWFHVDGAYGALAMLAPDLAPKLAGIERADSLAFDFHKWGQVPYDAGYILVRDGQLHKNAFSSPAPYLKRVDRGLAAGSPWPCDFGPDLSRSFRALKTWLTLKVYGTDALGAAISRTCDLAGYLKQRITETPELELMAPVELNVVCFRYRAEHCNSVNDEIVIALQESGIVAPSTTMINGQVAIRAAIVNHRTGRAEIDALVDSTLFVGRALQSNVAPPVDATRKESPEHAALKSALQSVNEQLEARPNSVALLFQRGSLQEQMGMKLDARKTWIELLKLDPSHGLALNNLANLMSAVGENDAARSVYAEAVARHPNDPMSRVNLAKLLIKLKEPEEAHQHLEHALQIDPTYRPAHAGMSFVLADLGQPEQASVHRRIAFQDRCIIPALYRGEQEPITVLELVSTTGGNIRAEVFLSDRIFKRYLVATEFYDPSIPLPPHQLVFNAIGDVDVAAKALAGAQALLAHTTAPVMNPPDAVLETSRCDVTRRLSGVPGVITPKTITLSREALHSADAQSLLAVHGLQFPVLLRTPGLHGGEHFLHVETREQLPAVLAELPGDDLTVIQYLDARSADGKTRKYRVMMIDGELYPLHVAISHQWKIHYFSADMAEVPEHRAEDAEFLSNMPGVLGPGAMRALKAIQNILRLDYGGIDFGLNQNGDVLLFEANATMAILPPGRERQWDYRRPAIEKACAAVWQMLMDKVKTN